MGGGAMGNGTCNGTTTSAVENVTATAGTHPLAFLLFWAIFFGCCITCCVYTKYHQDDLRTMSARRAQRAQEEEMKETISDRAPSAMFDGLLEGASGSYTPPTLQFGSPIA